MTITSKTIEQNVKAIKEFDSLEFVYQLLLAYGKPKSSITRLKKGTYNLSKTEGEIYWKKKLFFRYIPTKNSKKLMAIIDEISHDKNLLRHNPRFIIVSNWDRLLAINTRDSSSLDISITEIAKHYAFFLPLAGMEKSILQVENEADVKVAERMALLYDEIIHANPNFAHDKNAIHSLNIFLSRLLFCFFAEDTKIFPRNLLTSTLTQHTQTDGSDVAQFFTDIFQAMNQDSPERKDLPSHIEAFPYVNGRLFEKKHTLPTFSAKARRLLIESGTLNWAHINPDIFGSMIQAVVHPGERASLGMHYTSVENIMKVIKPLFLDNLRKELEASVGNKPKLSKLLNRIIEIKIFDPACGSGNFLIISYKELRRIENEILTQLMHGGGKTIPSQIKLENYYGIEIDDFAHEIAILSLWLAKHQMNIEYDKIFDTRSDLIPLRDVGSIVRGNAATLDWQEVCPNVPHVNDPTSTPIQGSLIGEVSPQQKIDFSAPKYEEIYLIGNPPYQGGKTLNEYQKNDVKIAFGDTPYSKNIDYISIWFIKASRYIRNTWAIYCFVSTNSINQGEQVSMLWPPIFDMSLEIKFAYTSFKWTNNAKHNAGVTCVIVAVGQEKSKFSSEKFIKTSKLKHVVRNINAYLIGDSANIIISKRTKALANIPHISLGSMPKDGGYLVLSEKEKDEILAVNIKSQRYIRKFIGSGDFINGNIRYCLWIKSNEYNDAISNPLISRRVNQVQKFRSKSLAKSTREYAKKPYRFVQIGYKATNSIIIPRVSSEHREYIPIGYLDKDVVISDSANAIYDAEPYIFGLISSRLHMAWVRAVAGKLETRIRYSSAIVYNNFPVPLLSEKQKSAITDHVMNVLRARQNHSEKTLAEMYDPDSMPEDLRSAHIGLDEIVELCYRTRPFESDEERLSYLFKEYEKMIAKEKEK
jgi:hypothetical protein